MTMAPIATWRVNVLIVLDADTTIAKAQLTTGDGTELQGEGIARRDFGVPGSAAAGSKLAAARALDSLATKLRIDAQAARQGAEPAPAVWLP